MMIYFNIFQSILVKILDASFENENKDGNILDIKFNLIPIFHKC